MIEVGKVYKHIYGQDVAIRVGTKVDRGEVFKCWVDYINICGQRHFCIDSEVVTIKKEDEKNWKEFESNYR